MDENETSDERPHLGVSGEVGDSIRSPGALLPTVPILPCQRATVIVAKQQ